MLAPEQQMAVTKTMAGKFPINKDGAILGASLALGFIMYKVTPSFLGLLKNLGKNTLEVWPKMSTTQKVIVSTLLVANVVPVFGLLFKAYVESFKKEKITKKNIS